MSDDPRGRWFRVYAVQVRDHDKFRQLSGLELGAWLALRTEAELRTGHIIVDRAEAVAILRRRSVPRPGQMLDALIERRLFDVDDVGRISFHDREDHDRPRFPSDDPERVRERVRRHRQKAEGNDGNDSLQTRYEKSNDTHARALLGLGLNAASESASGNEPSRARASAAERDALVVACPVCQATVGQPCRGVRPQRNGEPWERWSVHRERWDGYQAGIGAADDPVPDDWQAPDAVVAYHHVTGRFPSERVIGWLNRLSDDHPEEAIARVLAAEYAADSDPTTLLSRTENALKLEAHRRGQAERQARERAQRAAEAPHRKREEDATPEERERAAIVRRAVGLWTRSRQPGPIPTDFDELRRWLESQPAGVHS